jgi:hypothetical protein
MAKTKIQAKPETDSRYFLKLVLYVLLGMFWLRLNSPISIFGLNIGALPIGLVIGLLIASHDRFQIDRKIEYAVLVVIAIISLFLPIGLVI